MLSIRKCEESDEKVWIELNREFMDFEIQDDVTWNNTQKASDPIFRHTFREALNSPDLLTLLLFEYDEKTIGFANLMTVYSVWAHGKALIIDDLYIRKAYRGKGFGTEVMEYLEKDAREKEYKRLQFQSEISNPGALAFYSNLGYKPVDMHFYVRYL